jgi:hypothetical protein
MIAIPSGLLTFFIVFFATNALSRFFDFYRACTDISTSLQAHRARG